jgi:hypothetical protein
MNFLSAMEQGLDAGATRTKVQFSHNHLYDLELLRWVAVWVVFLQLLFRTRKGRRFVIVPSSHFEKREPGLI